MEIIVHEITLAVTTLNSNQNKQSNSNNEGSKSNLKQNRTLILDQWTLLKAKNRTNTRANSKNRGLPTCDEDIKMWKLHSRI